MFVMDCYGHKLSNGVLFAHHLILDAGRKICVPETEADLQMNRLKRCLRSDRGSARSIRHIGIPVRRNSEGVIQSHRSKTVLRRANLESPVPAMATRSLARTSAKRRAIDESSPT